VAELKGGFLLEMVLHDSSTQAALTEQGKTREVRDRHRAFLKRARDELDEYTKQLPLAEALVRLFQKWHRARNWSYATLHREMANAAGALSDLPLYTDVPMQVNIGQAPAWRNAMRTAEQRLKEHEGRDNAATMVEEIDKALEHCDKKPIRAALMLMWLTAARAGCTLKLERRDVQLADSGDLQVTFHKGKGVKFRGPYTVNSKCPARWLTDLKAFLRDFEPTQPLFPFQGATAIRGDHVRDTLRTANPFLGLRAMRRGSLQTMASNDVPLAVLMTFSGHTQERTLLRYLGWGRHAGQMAEQGREAARHLAGTH
jgi:integrase